MVFMNISLTTLLLQISIFLVLNVDICATQNEDRREFKCMLEQDSWKESSCSDKYKRLQYAGEPCNMTHFGMACCKYCRDKLEKSPHFPCKDKTTQCSKYNNVELNKRNLYFLTVYCYRTTWCSGKQLVATWWTTTPKPQKTTPDTKKLAFVQPRTTADSTSAPPTTPSPTDPPTSVVTVEETSPSPPTIKTPKAPKIPKLSKTALWLSPEKVIEQSVERALKALIDRQRVRNAQEAEERRIREEDLEKEEEKQRMLEEMEANIPPEIKQQILKKFNPGSWWPFTG